MTEKIKQLLFEAKHEITSLRRVNEILQAKVEVMNLFAAVFHTQPPCRGDVMSVDLMYEIDKALEQDAKDKGVNERQG